ncbi:MAG: hypothetical protein ACJ8F7_08855 [Gemmataceae bacterium]
MPTDPLTELETALTGLAPAGPRLDRDGLLYAAGRAAGARPWKRAAGSLALAAVALAVFVGFRPVRERERVVTVMVSTAVESPKAVEPPSSSSPSAEPIARADESEVPRSSPQLEMRWRMLHWGPDSVPVSVGGPAPASRSLEQDLDLPPGSLNGADHRRKDASTPW